MIEVGEALGPEEALVPHVVEVLDDPVAPWLPQRDEPRRHVQAKQVATTGPKYE